MATRRSLARLRSSGPAIGELFKIVRELSFDELREEAQLPPRLLLVGANHDQLVTLRDALGGSAASGFIDVVTFEQLPGYLDLYDGIVLVNAGPTERNRPKIRQLTADSETAGRTLTFQLPPGAAADGDVPPPPAAVDDLRSRLVTRLGHRQLALGRYLPTFRKQVTSSLINQTARANAEFALLSNIPAVIPIVGNLMSAGADFLVLTKNQLMLIYKLAAAHGRDIDQPWRLYTEMLPVVGAGLVWRTVAREMAALIPFAAGTIPKVLIAYAGTAVTGQAANYYYEFGAKPTGAQLRRYYERAVEVAKTLRPGAQVEREAIEGEFTEVQAPVASERAPVATEQASRPPTADVKGDDAAAR
jgi:uncharacterized protein (DUF697 family)